ncbi:ankyrin repeat-containing domain protein [Mycena rebaudengoi]|nr:ankyrin repeat-containing domain protein [Mycena rebaudengoi]
MADPLGIVANILQLITAAKVSSSMVQDIANAPKEQRNLFAEVRNLEPLLKSFEGHLQANSSVHGMLGLKDPLAQFKDTMEHVMAKLQSANKPGLRIPKALIHVPWGPSVMYKMEGVLYWCPSGTLSATGAYEATMSALSWTLWNKEAEEDLVKMERFKALLNMWLVLDIWDIGQQQQNNHDRKNSNIVQFTVESLTDFTGGLEIIKAVADAAQGHHREQDVTLNKITDVADDQRKHIDWLEAEHAAAERKRIIEWISLLNFFQQHDNILYARQEGTGLWLLEDTKFKDWVSGAGAIFWCYGIQGRENVVVDYPQEKSPSPNVGVACAYLNYKETDMQSPENILAGLWWQLILQSPFSRHLEKQTRPSINEMHAILSSVVTDYFKVYIVIDALDEYPETKHHVLLKHLAALKPNINLLFTSRPHITPEIFFPNTPALEIRATEEDIRRYLDAQIQNSFRLSKHVQSHPELYQEIDNQIIGNVDGMFLLAKLHIDSLTTRNTVKAVCEALKNIFLSVCAGLAVINHADGSVRFIHYTTQDYMDRVQTSKFPYAQTEIARGCLTYLLYNDFLQLPDSPNKLHALGQEHALLDYSFCYCLVHSVGQPELILRNMILTFLAHASRWLSRFWPSVRPKQYPHSSWDIYNKDFNTSTDLFFSALFNLQETAKYILAHDTSIQDQHKEQDLIGAAQSGSLGMVQLPINQGANVNEQGGHYGNALQAVSVDGHEAVVQLLLNQGANVNAQGGNYGNALQAASVEGHEAVVQLLLNQGANVNAQGGHYGTALQAASKSGNEAVVKLLIDQGADVNAQGGYYGNALLAASYRGHEAVVQLLLNGGADVNAQGGQYGTALQAASMEGHEAVVQLLLNQGANVNAQGGNYGNALQAVSVEGHEAVVQLLLNQSANVNAQGGQCGIAFQAASRSGNEAVVKLLLDQGVNVNSQGKEYGTALQAASYRGHEAVVQLLLNRDADVNAQVVQLLLDRGADVNAQGGRFGTALQAASTNGHKEVIQLLLANGALPNEDFESDEEEKEE